jgi:hypothetical protein
MTTTRRQYLTYDCHQRHHRRIHRRRDVTRLDVQRHRSELGDGWLTTLEQTLIDLIARPGLGGAPDADAVAALIPRADTDLLRQLATDQRHRRAVEHAGRQLIGLGFDAAISSRWEQAEARCDAWEGLGSRMSGFGF